ncbi:hypothetical protein M409DRAFT_24058 [Zasmidium cellare ATCC 36951]|uniref:Uncharacterized protein n=1 Tax=Zasmidium cellare ATCC 36951 TaxID=1080233 RepID=A0A6A6CII5_ZASCE|nr:uncharacterized protein M409DRAFT_24058 [Zasmidium cellare ATCC 36951]KAF2165772.1 hypothetical protein M409DRAFT_24058 [Zasmidium cellare ATCC 36951]
MARTKQTARKSTCGKAPRKALATGHCRLRRISSPPYLGRPKVSGTWTKNRLGQRVHTTGRADGEDPAGREVMVVPNHCAVVQRLRVRQLKKGKAAGRGKGPRGRKGEGGSAIERLPNELLHEILALLIRTNTIFHFSPEVGVKPPHRQLHSIHALSLSHTSSPPPSSGLPLASISKRFHSLVYTIFYSQNTFILELCGFRGGLTSHISVEHTGSMLDSVDNLPPNLESWNKIVPATRKTDLASPLSSGAMEYISDLTICVGLSSSDVGDEERETVREMLEGIKACFPEGGRKMRRLVVNVDVLRRRRGRLVSQSLVLRTLDGVFEMGLKDPANKIYGGRPSKVFQDAIDAVEGLDSNEAQGRTYLLQS